MAATPPRIVPVTPRYKNGAVKFDPEDYLVTLDGRTRRIPIETRIEEELAKADEWEQRIGWYLSEARAAFDRMDQGEEPPPEPPHWTVQLTELVAKSERIQHLLAKGEL